jgi:phage/plasmid-like protein (TIGR03299 family)
MTRNMVLPPAFSTIGSKAEGVKTSEELIRKAGLAFKVIKVPNLAEYEDDFGEKELLRTNSFSTIRTDTKRVLGDKIGSRYEVIQNHQGFDFIDSLVEDGLLTYERAGQVDGGAKIFVTAKLPDYIKLSEDDGDIVELRVLLTMAHDGSGSVKVQILPMRLICSNGMLGVAKGLKQNVSIRHSQSANTKLHDAHKVVELIDTRKREIVEHSKLLQQVTISDNDATKFLAHQLLNRDEFIINGNGQVAPSKFISTRKANIFSDVVNSVRYGIGQNLASTKGNLFGIYNGVAYYHANIKSYKDEEQRFNAVFDGRGLNEVSSIYNSLLNLANITGGDENLVHDHINSLITV